MTTETNRHIDSEILDLKSGLFDGGDQTTTAGPLIDVLAPVPSAGAAPRAAVRARASRARRASWAVIAATGAALVGGLAAAGPLSSMAAPPRGPLASLAFTPDRFAVSAIGAPSRVDTASEAPAVAAEDALGVEAAVAMCATLVDAPPAEPAAAPSLPRALRDDEPAPAPKVPPLTPVTTWRNPIEALAAGAKDFSKPAAAVAIASAAHRAGRCTRSDDPRTTMSVRLTFAPSGQVTSAAVSGGPFVGTAIGSCIGKALHAAAVRPFDGDPVTVNTSIHLHGGPSPRGAAPAR